MEQFWETLREIGNDFVQNTGLAIVRAVAADAGLRTPAETLEALAERWALVHGGRSPRRARQFVDYAYSCECKGREIEV